MTEPERLCAGRSGLFLSTDPTAHEKAATICATCPALTWCEKDRDDQLRGPYKIGVHGTLAGRLYDDGKRVASKVSVDDCPQCGVVDGERCKSAAGVALGAPHKARQLGLPKCGICSTVFIASRTSNRYCSKACSREAIRVRKARRFANQKNACVTCLAPTSKTYCRTCAAKKGRAARDAA